jgi:hypothetical protein
VSNNTTPARAPSITARPTPDEKRRFAELAAQRGVSEAMLALTAIRVMLESNGPAVNTPLPDSGGRAATDRITIRLRPGDGRVLNQRAARRGMKSSTYLAALVRAHIAASPPLTVDELAILKEGVSILARLSRALAHTTQCIAKGEPLHPKLQEELTLTRKVVGALERRTHDLARSALVTWESRYE